MIYLIVGPGFWIAFSFAMASSRRRMNFRGKAAQPIPEPLPRVTILIPAKDEGERIGQCLASALAQDYPAFEVLGIDDRSGDETGRIMDEMAAADNRVKVLHIQTLPDGWTGKNNALHCAVGGVATPWLLFVDSDVVLQPHALSSTLRIAIARRYDMLSLILKQETRGIWESALVPIASVALGSAFLMGLSNSESNNYYFGNGQFMLFSRAAYDRIGGHETVKNQYNEDMAIARIMKHSNLRPRIAWGTDLGSVRMYDSLPKIMRGWSRIFFGSSCGSPWRSLIVIYIILTGCYSSFAAGAWGIYRLGHSPGNLFAITWLALAAAHWIFMTLHIGIMYRWMETRAIYAVAFVITGLFLLAILGKAVWMCITGRVKWRGTSYSHRIDLANPTKP